MQEVLREDSRYDIVVLAGVGGVLGDFAQTVGRLREALLPGGYLVVDDGFLARSSRSAKPGYEHYRSHEETIRQLTAHGDTLRQEVRIPIEELKAYNQSNMEFIHKRADTLARRHPELVHIFNRFVQAEQAECRMQEEETVPAIWLLQRG